MTRTALITGASGGIGQASVELFAGEGWHVVATDLRGAQALPAGVSFRQVDISDESSLQACFQWLAEEVDGLDALVNNAAIQVNKPLLETSAEEWDRVMATNLRSAFLACKFAHPLLKKDRSGAIVNVSSVHALATSSGVSAYAASKGGLLALTRAAAIEFAADGIRVNAVLPGAVDTEMLHAGLARGHAPGITLQDRLDNLAANTVIGRVAQPNEIAKAIYFLADDSQSSFMTGQALVVDGGATTRLSTE